MQLLNSTKARKEWSRTIDTVVREKPVVVKRSRDHIYMVSEEDFIQLLSNYEFTASEFTEDDGSITLSLNEIDIIVNEPRKEDAIKELVYELKEYAEEYYKDFDYWYSGLNRKKHYPYVMRVLALDDVDKIKELIKCQAGKI